MRGYAELATSALIHLRIKKVAVLGWSLGGHVGIEMIPLLKAKGIEMKGLMLVGTPPALGVEQIKEAFVFENPHMALPAQQEWSDEEAAVFARTSAGEPFEPWMEECAKQTDGRARVLMWTKFAGGHGLDQRREVETNEDVLVAVVNGGAEPFINLDYLDGIQWKRLWKGKCLRLEGLKHAPFWERPDIFEEVLEEFMKDCDKE